MLPLGVVVRVADWGRQENTKEMVADVKEGRSRKSMKSTCISGKKNWVGASGHKSGDLSFHSLPWYVHVVSVSFVPRTIRDTRKSVKYQNFHSTLRDSLHL